MGYRLAVDLGTAFTAAAIVNGSAPVMVGLGSRAMQVPSVLFLAEDGSFSVGEAAERRGVHQPDRLVREFKRRFGDPVPILVAGVPFSPESLMARLLSWVVSETTTRQGEAPEQIMLTHPGSWGPYKLELLDQMVALAELAPVQYCTEPVAAAVNYAARAKVVSGDRVAVYDLGGGTFDACVLEKRDEIFVILGTAGGIQHLGGSDIDQALMQLVLDAAGLRLDDADLEDPAMIVGLTRLRRECIDAKEALSTEMDATVPVALPQLTTSVQVKRVELEARMRPALIDTVAALRRTLASAGVTSGELRAIVLVGGGSRIPLVSELLRRELPEVPLSLDTHPKHDIATGAALLCRQRATSADGVASPQESDPQPNGRGVDERANERTRRQAGPTGTRHTGSRIRTLTVIISSTILIAAAAAFFVATGVPTPRDGPTVNTATTSSASTQECGFVESFDSSVLNPQWRRTRPDADVKLEEGTAELTAPDGADVYEGQINAPMLLRQATGDFLLEADLTSAPSQFYQGAGLVVLHGDDYVRLELGYVQFRGPLFEYKDEGPHRFVRSPRTGRRPVATDVDRVVLRLVRDNQTVIALWRPATDTKLQELGRVRVTFGETVDVGVSVLNGAQSGARPEAFQARFDRVTVTC